MTRPTPYWRGRFNRAGEQTGIRLPRHASPFSLRERDRDNPPPPPLSPVGKIRRWSAKTYWLGYVPWQLTDHYRRWVTRERLRYGRENW